MQVRIEDVSPVEKKLIVEVPWKTVDSRLTKAYRELGRTVQLRGFRKGKVPRSVLQRMYGKHVRAEVTTQLVRESFISATAEHQLMAVSEPRIDTAPTIEKGQPLAFEAIVEVKGEVVAENYDAMELLRPRVEVNDEEVASSLERLREEHAELQPIEGRDVTARTDVLTVKLSGTIGEHEIDRPSQYIDLSTPDYEPLPGLARALTGLPVDVADHGFELTVDDDHADPAIAGKTAKLTVSILDARVKEKPELDDDFAIDLDRGETLDALRASIRAEIEGRREEAADRELRKRALSKLVENNPIPVASALVERGMQMQFERVQMMMGMPLGESKLELTDEMRESLRPGALEEVRGELLLEAVANQENVEVTADELDGKIAELASQRNVPPAKMRADLDRDGQLDSVEYQVRRDKTLDFLVEKAKVSDEPPEGEGEEDTSQKAATAGDETATEAATAAGDESATEAATAGDETATEAATADAAEASQAAAPVEAPATQPTEQDDASMDVPKGTTDDE